MAEKLVIRCEMIVLYGMISFIIIFYCNFTSWHQGHFALNVIKGSNKRNIACFYMFPLSKGPHAIAKIEEFKKLKFSLKLRGGDRSFQLF